jgi:hypothetical protein
MAHRWFATKGICSLLVETSPDWPKSQRTRAYGQLIASVLNAIGTAKEPLVVKNLAAVESKQRRSSEWVASLYKPGQPAPKSDNRGNVACWVAIITIGALITGRGASSKRTAGREESKRSPARAFSMTEAVQSDLSIRARLALIQQHRQRPCDRGKDREQQSSLAV